MSHDDDLTVAEKEKKSKIERLYRWISSSKRRH
jgi:hypothetical protein